MKLIHKEWTFELVFRENLIQRVVVEKPEILTSFVLEMQRWIEGEETGWILSEDGKLLKPSKECELILDYFHLDINQRKMINYLHTRLETEIYESELLLSWQELNSSMQRLIECGVELVDHDVTYVEPDLKAVLKMLNVSFRSCAESSVERLMEYQELINEVLGVKLFIMINATTYFSNQDLLHSYEQAAYKKYYLLLLDAQWRAISPEKENIMIIDQDACVIQKNL